MFRKENLGFAGIQSLNQIAFGAYCAFLVMYLQMNGYTNAQCGLAVTLQYVTCLVLQPFYGYLTDTYLSSKRFLIIMTSLSIPTAFLLPMTVGNVPLAMLSIFLFSCFFLSNDNIIAAWILLLRDEYTYLSYEITRGVASVMYAFFALGFGVLLQRFGTNLMFITFAVLAFLMVVVCMMLQEVPCQNSRAELASHQERLSIWQVTKKLMHNQPYILYLISALFYQIGMKATKTFLSNYVVSLGGQEQELGVIFFAAALVELPALYLLGRISRRYKVEYSYLITLAALLLNLIFLKTMTNMAGLIVAVLFSGVAYIGSLGVFMQFVKQVTPRQYNSTAIMLGMALTSALGSILGAYFGGIIIDQIGLDALTWSALFCCVAAFVIFLPLLRKPTKAAPVEG